MGTIATMILVASASGYLFSQRSTVDNHYQDANDLFSQGKWEQAIDTYTAALEVQPQFVRHNAELLYAKRGAAYFHHGEYEQALADLQQALDLQPDLLVALAYRGATWLRLGQFQAARADLDLVLQQDPERALAYAYRCWLLYQEGDVQGALQDAGQAVARSRCKPRMPWPNTTCRGR